MKPVTVVNPTGLALIITDAEHRAEFHAAIHGYLNTRADAPRWLFDLCDSIDPNPVPKS